jgi:hypothetical protein
VLKKLRQEKQQLRRQRQRVLEKLHQKEEQQLELLLRKSSTCCIETKGHTSLRSVPFFMTRSIIKKLLFK